MALAFPSRDQAFSPSAGKDHGTSTPAFDSVDYYTKSGETLEDRGAHGLELPLNIPVPGRFPHNPRFSE